MLSNCAFLAKNVSGKIWSVMLGLVFIGATMLKK